MSCNFNLTSAFVKEVTFTCRARKGRIKPGGLGHKVEHFLGFDKILVFSYTLSVKIGEEKEELLLGLPFT